MQARQLPFIQGATWITQGYALWRRNPALLTFASFSYLLILVMISAVPLIGQPIASLLMPVLSLGVLNTCRAIDQGKRSGADILFSGFRSNVPALLTVGGLYLIGSLLVLMLTLMFDGGTLMSLMNGETSREAMQDANLLPSLTIALLLSTPVIMAYWFAAVLVGWWEVNAPKAMFFSFVACARNWRPFLAYGIVLGLVGGMLPGMVISTAQAIAPLLGTVALLLIPLVLIPVVFASFYINARDVFALDQPDTHTVSLTKKDDGEA